MDNILIEKLEEAAIYTLDVGDAGLFESAAAKIAELEEERNEYHAMVVYMGAIMDESEGVAGYHLNGDIAKWDDLFTVPLYEDALQAHNLEQQAKALSEYSEHLISEAEEIPIGLEHKGRGSNIYNWQTHFARELRYRANKLSNAKEALKEQVK